MNKLIGLYSPAPQSGKSLAANVLVSQCYRSMSFANPIKQMGIQFFMSLGYPKDQAASLVWAQKEKHIPEINTTPRHVLQTLGTQWGRDCIGQNIWIDCMIHSISACAREGDCRIVIDDVRFLNEALMIKQMGGEMWKIVRPSAIYDGNHESEGSLNDWDGFDKVIENTGTIHEFRSKIDAVIQGKVDAKRQG